MRIEQSLDAAHQLDIEGIGDAGEPAAIGDADAVLGADRPALRRGLVIDDLVDLSDQRGGRGRVLATRAIDQRDDVDVAVADMTMHHDVRMRHGCLDPGLDIG